MAPASVLAGEERRGLSLTTSNLTVRGDGDDKRFFGHACVFDVRTAIGNPLTWGFYEECAPGMFTKTLSEGDQRMLIDHDSFYVVSRVSAGSLSLAQDKVGLATDSALDTELSYVRDLKVNIANRNITGMSFGFYVINDEWTTEEVELKDGNKTNVEVRRITEVRLLEVSAVTFPAYEQTDAGLRAALRSRGDVDAVRARADKFPNAGLDKLVEEMGGFRKVTTIDLGANSAPSADDVVVSDQSEPGETTRSDEKPVEESTEPGETTRVAPSELALAKARLAALKPRLRLPV